ncbi:MAG: hypothetical protein GX182_03650 [Firmicutes bacterium]|nr:hypothetical protein [Bacillota bacterium]
MTRKRAVRKGKNYVVRQLTEEPCRDLTRHLSAEGKSPADKGRKTK